MRHTHYRLQNMARNNEKREKIRNTHCRIWNMARKLEITENENNTRQVVKYVAKY